jgi:hypothetical protein
MAYSNEKEPLMPSVGQILADIGPAFQIAGSLALVLEEDYSQFELGQPVSIPAIMTYIGGKHVAIDITITPQNAPQAPASPK